MTKTTLPKVDEIKREWHEVDARDFTLGRLATRVAEVLQGKHKPIYTPHLDVGDFVVVTNPDQVQLTGRKLEQKKYFRYSGYPGGITEISLKELLEKRPEQVIREAVRRMLPKNKLQRGRLNRLRIIKPGEKHTYKIDQKIK